jgi:SAM-dependent methyltransferase
MSKTMLQSAEKRRASLPSEVAKRLNFEEGDVRTFRKNETFDIVLSLFHVFSYQTSNDDLAAAFTTAASHLRPGGILIFDFWYGPGVLTQRPDVRVKRLEDERIRVMRIAEPVLFPNDNRVQVNYTVQIENRVDGEREEIRECHEMRYLFPPEIELLSRTMFKPIKQLAWMKTDQPGIDDWACVSIMESVHPK